MRRRRSKVGAALEGRLDGARGGRGGLVAGDARNPRPGQDGAHIGERVAPGVVVHGGDEDEIGARRARGGGAGGDQAGRGAALAGRLQREAGRSCAAVVGDREADAAGPRVEGGVERLAGLGASRAEARAAERVGEELGHDQGGVLRGAAAGHDDRLARGGRGGHGVSQPRRLGAIGSEDRRRQSRLRQDHLFHHPGRRVAQLGNVVGQPVFVVTGHRSPPQPARPPRPGLRPAFPGSADRTPGAPSGLPSRPAGCAPRRPSLCGRRSRASTRRS